MFPLPQNRAGEGYVEGGLGSYVKTTGWEGGIIQAFHECFPTICALQVICLLIGDPSSFPPPPREALLGQAAGIFLPLLVGRGFYSHIC